MTDNELRRPGWDAYFIDLVNTVATRATCDRGRSGCVVVRDNQLITTGYVGSPPGFPHCDAVGHLWSDDEKHCVRTLHAEQNAILQAARLGVSLAGTTIYCTMTPCPTCAMMLVSLGVIRVVALHPYPHVAGSRTIGILNTAGVHINIVNDEATYVP